jgi:hypothetical protein
MIGAPFADRWLAFSVDNLLKDKKYASTVPLVDVDRCLVVLALDAVCSAA